LFAFVNTIKNIKAGRKVFKHFNDDPVCIQPIIRPDEFDSIEMASKGLGTTRSRKCGEEIMREAAAIIISNSQAGANRNKLMYR